MVLTTFAVNNDNLLPVSHLLCLYAAYDSASEQDRGGRHNPGSRPSAKRQSGLVQGFGTIHEESRCLESYVSYHDMCLDIQCTLLSLAN